MICHVTAVLRTSSSLIKKEKEIPKKRNIKSRKIKRKILVLMCIITNDKERVNIAIEFKKRKEIEIKNKR